MKQILFIINTISKGNLKSSFDSYINKSQLVDNYSYDTIYTGYSGHAYKIANDNKDKYQIIVAVGGDGTVNQVSRALIHSNATLGIIPIGSGNGLARYLGIPLSINKALQLIVKEHVKAIDCATINGNHFINMAGIGIDGYIAHKFAKSKKRGFKSYIINTLKAIASFKTKHYHIQVKDENIYKRAVIVSFANSTQYGNNAHISPEAKIDDGMIDICIIRKFPYYCAPKIIYRLFARNIHKSKYVDIHRSDKALIRNTEKIYGHIDGEPIELEQDINLAVQNKSVKIIVP